MFVSDGINPRPSMEDRMKQTIKKLVLIVTLAVSIIVMSGCGISTGKNGTIVSLGKIGDHCVTLPVTHMELGSVCP